MADRPKNPLGGGPPPDIEASGAAIDHCGVVDCDQPVYSKGYCAGHQPVKRGPGRPRKNGPAQAQSGGKAEEEISAADLEGIIAAGMQLLATTIDESFSALDIEMNADGSLKSATVKPHVSEAVSQMMPWMKIYGASLIKILPWTGLVGGCLLLAAPAFDPCCEIIAGVRKPRIMRKPSPGNPDIYTDAYKMAQATRASKSKKAATVQQGQNGKAADAVIESQFTDHEEEAENV